MKRRAESDAEIISENIAIRSLETVIGPAYVKWVALWHIGVDNEVTACGRRIPGGWHNTQTRTTPPDEVYICQVCRSSAQRPEPSEDSGAG